ncbi:MAG: winged helix-turn-helix domain-containing protein [Methanosphaera sp.]|nr:winged helix-turn-helix domain-containing protein [Methanosphaera sp.]
MIVILTKTENADDVINRLTRKYQSKTNLINEYEKTNDRQLYIDLEDWNYFEKHPEESQEHGRTIVIDNFNLNEIDFKILSYIKHKKINSLTNLSKEIGCTIKEANTHLKKLVKEGFLHTDSNELPTINYDEIKIQL